MATLDAVAEQLRAAGLVVEALDTSGVLQVCPVEGDRGRKRSGWYVVHEQLDAHGGARYFGAFGNHKDGIGSRTISIDWRELSAADRDAAQARMKAARRAALDEQRARAEATAARAAALWARLPSEGASEYLARKRCAGHGVRYARGALVVPVREIGGALRGLQWIAPDGTKRFLTGTQKRGSVHLIGAADDLDPDAPLLIAEGYATAATCYEATGWPALVAFDAGNIAEVCAAARARWPAIDIMICADDDAQTTLADGTRRNTGLSAARAASMRFGACVAVPTHAPVALYPGPNEGVDPARPAQDWNDVRCAHSLETVRDVLRSIWAAWCGLRQPADKSRPPGEDPVAGDWRAAFESATKGGKRASQLGVTLVLQHDERWTNVLAHNTFTDDLVKRSAPPWPGGDLGEWTDRDSAYCVDWMSRCYQIEPSAQALAGALTVAARPARYHPVRDWLEALPDRGTELLDVWLAEGLGAAASSDYLRSIGRRWLIGAVARVMRPGCKMDTVLILEGAQGRGKSTAIQILFGDWYTDQPIIFGDRDTYLAIRGRWCVELAELDAWRKSEHTQSKAFVSQRVDRYRPPYGSRMIEVPRQTVFCGTTNQNEYLRDATGNRRYWPVRCGSIDLDWMREHRGDLFREALAAYQAGERWWLDESEESIADRARDQRTQEDPWEETIAAWIRRSTADRWSTADLLAGALGFDHAHIQQQHQTRVAYAMRRLGYVKTRWRTAGGAVTRGYRIAGDAE